MRFCRGNLGRCEYRFIAGPTGLKLLQRRGKCFLYSTRRITPHRPATHQILPIFPDKISRSKNRSYGISQDNEPTIYALSTAPGPAAIAIIRISGSACLNVFRALCPGKGLPKPRYATLRTFYDPYQVPPQAEVLDAGALVIYFPAPETATGEDILELHVHGGTAVIKAILAAIAKIATKDTSRTIRYAEPGEFTKRAFYNNRLDLTQVESLGETLAAETEQQRRLAVKGSTSILAKRYEGWRYTLVCARGELEALIDFSEDQHFDESPSVLCASVAGQVQALRRQLQVSIESASRGELLRNGISIALVGAPNAGKSSLLNRIVGREAAIVSEQAGTTRDIVDVNVDIGGYLCRFGDLAGLRKKHENASHDINSIEEEGIRRGRERALKSNVVIVLLSVRSKEASETSFEGRLGDVYLGDEVEATLTELDPESQKVICVLNKADLFPDRGSIKAICTRFSQHPSLRKFLQSSNLPVLPISCKEANSNSAEKLDPGGVQSLLKALTRLFGNMTEAVNPLHDIATGNNAAWAESLGATERQRVLLQHCLHHLNTFLDQVNSNGGVEGNDTVSSEEDNNVDIVLAAESLRSAANCLAKITGKGEAGDVEEVLGVVFEKFCVGK